MNELKVRVEAVFREIGGKETGVKSISKLHGDASYRVYFRATLADGSTRIIMQMPEGRSSASEEITNFKGPHTELPFINIARFLSSLGLPVPDVLGYSESKKMMVLSDLGDDLFIKFVSGADPRVQKMWYKKAIDLLISLQTRCSGKKPSDCIALRRSFDPTLFDWEFDHFREYLVEERLGKKMSEKDKAIFEDTTRDITTRIMSIEKVFTHRDFQSKNLIVGETGALTMIDFQDALVGPRVYDLVSLLRDSYITITADLREELIGYYCRAKGLKDEESEKISAEFDLVTLQRKMKDAGRFVYIDRVKKNPDFLQYIPATLNYVEAAFERLLRGKGGKKMADLFEMLKNYVPEWNK